MFIVTAVKVPRQGVGVILWCKSSECPVSNCSGRNIEKCIIGAFAGEKIGMMPVKSHQQAALGLLYFSAHPGGLGSTSDEEGRIARWEINICGVFHQARGREAKHIGPPQGRKKIYGSKIITATGGEKKKKVEQ